MPGNPLSITLPTVGTTVGPTYATQINAAIQALIDDVEANIVTGEITINADLSFASAGTSYGATDLDRAVFTEQDAALASGNTLSVYAYADELYFQDGAGNNVAITAGGSVAAAAGNITTSGSPAYGSSGVELAWVGGDLEFQFKAGASAYADLVFHEADFRNGANTMKMTSNVTSDYSINFPAAGPSVNNLISLDASGNISFTNTIAGAKTFSGAVTCSSTVATGALTVTGAMSATTSVTCASAAVTNAVTCASVTATGDVAAATVTSSGAVAIGGGAKLIHPPWTQAVAATAFVGASVAPLSGGAAVSWGSGEAYAPIPLVDHRELVTAAEVYVQQSSAGTLTLKLLSIDPSTGTSITLATATTAVEGSFVALNFNVSTYTPADDPLCLEISGGGGTRTCRGGYFIHRMNT